MTHYRIRYKIGCGYYIQSRDWTSCWMWLDIGKYNGDNFHVSYYRTLKEAHNKVKDLSWKKTQERTV